VYKLGFYVKCIYEYLHVHCSASLIGIGVRCVQLAIPSRTAAAAAPTLAGLKAQHSFGFTDPRFGGIFQSLDGQKVLGDGTLKFGRFHFFFGLFQIGLIVTKDMLQQVHAKIMIEGHFRRCARPTITTNALVVVNRNGSVFFKAPIQLNGGTVTDTGIVSNRLIVIMGMEVTVFILVVVSATNMVVDDEYDGGGLVGSFNAEADGSTTTS